MDSEAVLIHASGLRAAAMACKSPSASGGSSTTALAHGPIFGSSVLALANRLKSKQLLRGPFPLVHRPKRLEAPGHATGGSPSVVIEALGDPEGRFAVVERDGGCVFVTAMPGARSPRRGPAPVHGSERTERGVVALPSPEARTGIYFPAPWGCSTKSRSRETVVPVTSSVTRTVTRTSWGSSRSIPER